MGQTFSPAWVTSSLSDFHFLGPKILFSSWDFTGAGSLPGGRLETKTTERQGGKEPPLSGLVSLGLLTLDHLERAKAW